MLHFLHRKNRPSASVRSHSASRSRCRLLSSAIFCWCLLSFLRSSLKRILEKADRALSNCSLAVTISRLEFCLLNLPVSNNTMASAYKCKSEVVVSLGNIFINYRSQKLISNIKIPHIVTNRKQTTCLGVCETADLVLYRTVRADFGCYRAHLNDFIIWIINVFLCMYMYI